MKIKDLPLVADIPHGLCLLFYTKKSISTVELRVDMLMLMFLSV